MAPTAPITAKRITIRTCGSAPARPHDHRRHHRAERRANEHDTQKVREVQDDGADRAADERGQQQRSCVPGADHRRGQQRAEDEPIDAEDDAEQAVAGEARDQPAEEQEDRNRDLQRDWEHAWYLPKLKLGPTRLGSYA